MMESSASGEPSSQESNSNIQLDPAFVDRLKIAAATAIIKQKPAAMSGKDYAKQLAERLREKEDTWKAKAKILEMELIKTKQELLLARTKTSIPLSINEQGETTTSHSDISTDEPAFLTPPSSSSSEYHHIDHEMALSRNTIFLHSLSTLSALSKTEEGRKLLDRSSEVIVSSVKIAVDYIMGKSKGKVSSCHLLSSRMLQEAAGAIVKCLDTRLPPGCKDDIVALVDKLVESALDEVMGNSKICNTYSQRESCCLLLRLSKSSHLLPAILTAILEKIEKVSTSLRNIRHHGNHLDLQLLENSFFLFSSMEDILVSVQTSSPETSSSNGSSKHDQITLCSTKETPTQLNRTPSDVHFGLRSSQTCDEDDRTSNEAERGKSVRGKTGSQSRKVSLDQGFRTNIQQRLEDSLLHISHDFPLYAQYVWRLTGILELMNE